LRHVAREALCVDEAPLVPEDARIDQHGSDRSILASHAGRVFHDLLAAMEAREDVDDRCLLDVKLRDVVADVFVPRVAEGRELGVIGPENHAVRTDTMNADRRGLEKGGELACLPANLAFRLEQSPFVPAYHPDRPPEKS